MPKYNPLVSGAYTTRRNEKGEMIIDTTIQKSAKHNAYIVTRNIKYKGIEYVKGDNIEATGEDLDFLLKNNLIQ